MKAFQEKPKHMIKILHDFKETCIVMSQFQAILNDQLKAVTGNPQEIINVSSRVTEHVQKLAIFEGDVFVADPAIEQQWRQSFQSFQSAVEAIEVDTVALIRKAFDDNLSSSLNAFSLLENFKEIDTRPEIIRELSIKYENVLE